MFEPNRGGNLWCGVQSQGQKDRYKNEHVGPFSFVFTFISLVK